MGRKEVLKQFVMVGERNSKRIKKMSKQMPIETFVSKMITVPSIVHTSFPKITVWDVVTKKAITKILAYTNKRFENGVTTGLRTAKVALSKNISLMIEEDK